MTTKVTVDAHAGWPVKVTRVDLDNALNPFRRTDEIVAPFTQKDFYIHTTLKLEIEELPK
jgi:hypothetical protein